MPETGFTIGAFFVVAFCVVMGYFCAVPLFEGTHLKMPRSFFAGMTITSVGFGLSFLYALLNHPTKVTIDPGQMTIRNERRVFGSIQRNEKAITEQTKLSKEVRHMQNSQSAGVTLIPTYDIHLINAGVQTKLYLGAKEEEANKLVEFCADNNMECIEAKTAPNKIVMVGTVLFMVALLAELYSMGSLN